MTRSEDPAEVASLSVVYHYERFECSRKGSAFLRRNSKTLNLQTLSLRKTKWNCNALGANLYQTEVFLEEYGQRVVSPRDGISVYWYSQTIISCSGSRGREEDSKDPPKFGRGLGLRKALARLAAHHLLHVTSCTSVVKKTTGLSKAMCPLTSPTLLGNSLHLIIFRLDHPL